MASSSNSDLNGGEQKQTVLGQGGIGRTKIFNSNSNIKNRYKINNYYGARRRNDLDVSKDTRGDIIPTSELFGETTARRNMEKIWDLIIGDVKKIGLYGMGGIGKTTIMKHINNRISEGKTDKFDCVIWVTVSKESSIFNLQHDIACKIDVNLSKYKDTSTRAGKLNRALKQKGRYLLILDDLWEAYPLQDVGIPDPDDLTSSNICKLVLTTRSLHVCWSMKCEAIEMKLLSKDEAWNLFIDHVGHDVLNVKGLEPIIRGVASECACLPLAISTIGRSMRGEKDASEWRDTLAKLRDFSKELGDKGRKVIEQLKFSFDRLENKKFQKCLMYCALFPEDDEIEKEELVKLLILEGIIEEKGSRTVEIDECNAILNGLINQCLLEGDGVFVKMHDLVRDMVLQIDDLHSQYLTIFDTETKKLGHVKWSEDLLKKIHISYCDSLIASPMCPRLTTFILCYSSLPNIPDSFFQHFEALKILKLSYCDYLDVLPDSISKLVNLVGLFIRHCDKLRYVPTLAMLMNLQSLEISYTSMRDIPKGLEKLSNLRYLNLFKSEIEVLPPQIILRLSNLRYLICDFFYELSVSELMGLENLEILGGRFGDIHNLHAFLKHREEEGSSLINYKIMVSPGYDMEDSDRAYGWESFDKVIKLANYTLCIPSGENDFYLLPKDVQGLMMENIDDLTSLCAIESLNYATDLQRCAISNCKGVKKLVTSSSSSSFTLPSLQTLRLHYLWNLKALISGKKAQCNVFPCLQELHIFDCRRIRVLFNVGLLSNFKNLEKLEVRQCYFLMQIIGFYNDQDLNDAMTGITFPKLRSLQLGNLTNLRHICLPTSPLICKSLKEINIEDCPELVQRVYAPLELEDSGEPSPSPSPSLQPIELKLYSERMERKTWKKLRAVFDSLV